MSELKLNNLNFEKEILNRNGLALVDFYADWYGPCKMVAPVIQEIAEERQDIAVGKINVDEESELARAFGVESIPMLVVIKNGKVVNHTVGARPKEQILAMLNI